MSDKTINIHGRKVSLDAVKKHAIADSRSRNPRVRSEAEHRLRIVPILEELPQEALDDLGKEETDDT